MSFSIQVELQQSFFISDRISTRKCRKKTSVASHYHKQQTIHSISSLKKSRFTEPLVNKSKLTFCDWRWLLISGRVLFQVIEVFVVPSRPTRTEPIWPIRKLHKQLKMEKENGHYEKNWCPESGSKSYHRAHTKLGTLMFKLGFWDNNRLWPSILVHIRLFATSFIFLNHRPDFRIPPKLN